MLRLRRNPAAGALLLALLLPLLTAGPGMPCGGGDVGHHAGRAHPAAEGQTGPFSADAVDAHAAHASAHGNLAEQVPAAENDGAVPSGEGTPTTPSHAPCTMGTLCSGTILGAPTPTLASSPLVHALAHNDARWTLHTSDLTLPRRPPRA